MKEMAHDGLLRKAAQRRYRLTVDSGSPDGPQFALVEDTRRRGMLSRARELRRLAEQESTAPRATPPAEASAGTVPAIPEGEERDEEVLAEIEALVSERKLDADTLRLGRGEGRLGIAGVILANAAVALVAVIAVFVVARIFTTRENAITLATEQLESTESRLIQELIAESQEALDEKNAEINQIQRQLADVAASRAALESSLNDELASRTEQLRAELEADIAAERARLQAQGASAADIEQQLAELQATREAEVAGRISALEEELQAEFDAQVDQLQSQAGALEAQLQSSEAELAAIENEAAEREAELEARLVAEQAESAAEVAAAQQRAGAAEQALTTLQQNQERSALLQDQLRASYEAAFRELAEADYDAALAALERRSAILNDPLYAALPGFEERRAAENRITQALERLIRNEALAADQDSDLADRFAADAERLEQERDAAVATLEEELASLRDLLDQEQDETAALRASLDEAEDAGALLQQELTAESAGRLEAQRELAAERARLARLDEELTTVSARLGELEEADAELGATAGRTEDAVSTAERDRLAEQVAALERELADTNEALEEARAVATIAADPSPDSDSRVAELEARVSTLSRREADLIAQLDAATAAVAVAEASLRRAERQLEELGSQEPAQQFIGTVSLVLGVGRTAQITVRLLVDDQYVPGQSVEIRRTRDDGTEIVVGVGAIERVRGGSLVVVLTEDPEVAPELSDAVFLLD